MIYFDNAATSFPKPPCVLKDVIRCCKFYCGNPGRSGHSMSIKAGEAIYSVRECVSELLEIDAPERVIFTQNATHALNIAIKGLICERCHVLISDVEHNSVIRPLASLGNTYGVEYSVFDHTSPDKILSLKRPDTKFIITTLRSNVTGQDIDFVAISRICKEHDIRLILDASQLIGHRRLSLKGLYYDALCAPAHKGLLGLQGAGFLVLSEAVNPQCLTEGGSGSNTFDTSMPEKPPERYESGTLSTPAIVALGSGIRYISRTDIDYIDSRIDTLTSKVKERLSDIKEVEILGANNGICAFNVGSLSSSYAADILDKGGICARGGYHCSPLAHRRLGTVEQGAVRISLSHFNSIREIDELYKYIKRTFTESLIQEYLQQS